MPVPLLAVATHLVPRVRAFAPRVPLRFRAAFAPPVRAFALRERAFAGTVARVGAERSWPREI